MLLRLEFWPRTEFRWDLKSLHSIASILSNKKLFTFARHEESPNQWLPKSRADTFQTGSTFIPLLTSYFPLSSMASYRTQAHRRARWALWHLISVFCPVVPLLGFGSPFTLYILCRSFWRSHNSPLICMSSMFDLRWSICDRIPSQNLIQVTSQWLLLFVGKESSLHSGIKWFYSHLQLVGASEFWGKPTTSQATQNEDLCSFLLLQSCVSRPWFKCKKKKKKKKRPSYMNATNFCNIHHDFDSHYFSNLSVTLFVTLFL